MISGLWQDVLLRYAAGLATVHGSFVPLSTMCPPQQQKKKGGPVDLPTSPQETSRTYITYTQSNWIIENRFDVISNAENPLRIRSAIDGIHLDFIGTTFVYWVNIEISVTTQENIKNAISMYQ